MARTTRLNDQPKATNFRNLDSQRNGDIINTPIRIKGWSNPTKQRNDLTPQRPGREK